MSLKRALSISFLLFVNMVILAHAVIPHHHHDGIPVLVAHHEHDENAPVDHHNDELHDYWLLTIVKIRLGNDKQIYQSCDFDFHLLPYLLTFFSDDKITQLKDDNDLTFEYHSNILPCHIAFIVCSTGLRAPPVC